MTGKGGQIEALVKSMRNLGKDHVKVQTAWATVTAVDWDERTMTVIGNSDALPYYDVSLGLGAVTIKPEIGSTCLIGIIENQDASSFLIDAEIVQEYSINVTDKVSIKNETESLKDLMDQFIDEIGKMVFTTNTGTTIKLLNKPKFVELKNKFNNLLK